VTVWNEAVAQQLLQVSVPDSFVSVDFDPRRNILCRAWVEAPAEELPPVVGDFHFYGAYPNPFNSAVCFEFNLPKASDVRLRLFDVLGREVTTLSPGLLHPGKGRILWQADGFPSGIYFAALEAGEFSAVTKVILLK
jgi:hypothetical protein